MKLQAVVYPGFPALWVIGNPGGAAWGGLGKGATASAVGIEGKWSTASQGCASLSLSLYNHRSGFSRQCNPGEAMQCPGKGGGMVLFPAIAWPIWGDVALEKP